MNRTTGTRFAVPGLAALAAALLAACGGGGGGGAAAPAAPTATGTYNVQAAFRNVLGANRSWALTDRVTPGVTLTLQLATATPDVFPPTPGQTYARSITTTTFSAAGFSYPQDGSVYYELTNNDVRLIGNRSSNGAACGLNPNASTAVSLPTAATVGQSGPAYTLDLRADCTSTSTIGAKAETSWQVVQEGGFVFFCLINRRLDNISGTFTESQRTSTCIEIDAAGALQGRAQVARQATGQSSASLDARNF